MFFSIIVCILTSFLLQYGDTDKRVEEAYTWLKAFTEQAVESAKLQARAKVAASKPVAAPQPAAANAGTKIGAPGPKPKKGKGGRSAN